MTPDARDFAQLLRRVLHAIAAHEHALDQYQLPTGQALDGSPLPRCHSSATSPGSRREFAVHSASATLQSSALSNAPGRVRSERRPTQSAIHWSTFSSATIEARQATPLGAR